MACVHTPRPKSGLETIGPYFELIRLSNPVGSLMIYFPHLFGSLVALSDQGFLHRFLLVNSICIPASIMLHTAGCSWNDIIDANLDRQVIRTHARPMARGAILVKNALIFTSMETLLWLALLRPIYHPFWWTAPLIPSTMMYPYAKWLTSYPSLTLGPIIAARLRVDDAIYHPGILDRSQKSLLDMVYAHQDKKDDIAAGIRSLAIAFNHQPRIIMAALTVAKISLIWLTGEVMHFGSCFTTLAIVGPAILDLWMVAKVNLIDPADCWWWFQYGTVLMGPLLATGMATGLNKLPTQ
ncbi:MAG: Para-hydroxybenzoate--polyprenyltransferase, mitochondrial precursor (PHB:polyprenyltransferase) [Bathelium mastoideum]|nr:MAG: Para-hydroxybenzoate--polyprenyltransferase, mitochondrial precursor (PHB:polyprenyltransferase) [Bathelium mastoideum]